MDARTPVAARQRRSRERGVAFPLGRACTIYQWLTETPLPPLQRSARAMQVAVARQLHDLGVSWPDRGDRWIRVTFRLASQTPVTVQPTLASGEAELRTMIARRGDILEWHTVETEPPADHRSHPKPERQGDGFEAILRRVQRNWSQIVTSCDI